MNRFEESSKHDFEKRVKLGEKNAECIKNMRQWCKHFEIEKTASGLYAEMTGLPIGSYKIQCPYAFGSESMDLPWICSDFLIKNCDGCEYHIPNGNTTWANDLIKKQREVIQKREQDRIERQEKISNLRLMMRDQAHEVGEQVQQESKQIVQFLEEFLSEDDTTQANSIEYLKQSASLAPDLFPESSIDLILTLALTDEYSEKIFPVCCELGKRRVDLHQRLKKIATESIQHGRCIEGAATVLESLGDSIDYPLDDQTIDRLLISQDHIQPLGGWSSKKTDYASITTILVRSFDADHESIQKRIRHFLQHEHEYLRINLCGAIALLQKSRPNLILHLLDDLMNSLKLYQENYLNQTPSGSIIKLFKAAFRHSPEQVDLFLSNAINRVRPTVQEEIVSIYRAQFFDRSMDWSERDKLSSRNDVSLNEQISIRRLINWVKDNKLNINTRAEAAKALEVACKYATGAILPEFDSLLGYYALIVEEVEPPQSPPSIIIPGQFVDPVLENLNENDRRYNWRTLKQTLVKCLEEICEERPSEVLDLIIGCFNNPQAGIGDEFKGTLVTLIGNIGKNYELRPYVLPLIMRALMDYGSAWVRAKAIYAAIEVFRYSKIAPPKNLVDTIVVHLRDKLVRVHKAAVYAVKRNPSWFDDDQIYEILNILSVHLEVYKKEPFQIKEICETILNFSQRNDNFKFFSLRLIDEVYPTGEEFVDLDLAKELTYFYSPSGRFAPIVGKILSICLERYERDRYDNHVFSSRTQMFEWLLQLSKQTFQHISEQLFDSAKIVAEKDTWESFHFANLFALFEAFDYECETLKIASNSLSERPKNKELQNNIDLIVKNAEQNTVLLRDNYTSNNSQSFEGIKGQE